MATVAARDILRPLRLPAYTFLGLTILLQGADFLLTVAPFRPSAVMWRFSALAGASSNVGNILLLLLLLYVFALLLQDGAGLATVVGLTSVLAIVLFLAGAAFALDALQLRSRVDSQVVQRFDVAAAEAILKFIAQGVVSILMAVSALRSWRLAKRQTMYRGERTSEELVMMRNTPSPRPVQD
jgi:hypothetical protein